MRHTGTLLPYITGTPRREGGEGEGGETRVGGVKQHPYGHRRAYPPNGRIVALLPPWATRAKEDKAGWSPRYFGAEGVAPRTI
jgi:hypothetical protein